MIKCNGWISDQTRKCGKEAAYFLPLHDAHGESFFCLGCCQEHWYQPFCHKGTEACIVSKVPIQIVERIRKSELREVVHFLRDEKFRNMCKKLDNFEEIFEYVCSVIEE